MSNAELFVTVAREYANFRPGYPPELFAWLARVAPARNAVWDCGCGSGQASTALAEPFSISLAAASKHIKALEKAGLIRREVRGRTHWCRLDPGPLASAHEWLGFYERFWTSRLDVLEELLHEDDARKAKSRKTRKRR